ncbi:nucleotidyltransferase domain-containing protein [Pyrobaculum neutrophilum]|uniref:nucleotidyltransferase domain-containing protein n=1 Tax=Pyrobaculum neutrophilum TaxID=70771 RepID=UPI00016166A1|nr:nucleotidyltransferase domain-containing protein [Pyrobaculum neutrophilum]
MSVRLFRLDVERVFRELSRYARWAVERGALAVVLIGSLARGDYTAFSDADVVIVVREDGRRPMDRIPDFLDPSFPIDLEPRVYTVEELRKMAGTRLAEEIASGVLLAGDAEVLCEAVGACR